MVVLDTSALIELFAGNQELMDRVLVEGAQLRYHPITLAEIADGTHLDEWTRNRKRPLHKARGCVSRRRSLLVLLERHRNQWPLKGNPFGDFRVLAHSQVGPLLPYMTNQRKLSRYRRQNPKGDRVTSLAHMTDHQILTLGLWLHKEGYRVTFVSGDQFQLGAAPRFTLPWVYAKEPSRTKPFPW